jgi:transcriptional regulator with XRE-family HTH domain
VPTLRQISRALDTLYRRKHGLLSADQIRGIRERFELTQAEFARLLRLGANTLSRWEAGRNVQTGAMDTPPSSLSALTPNENHTVAMRRGLLACPTGIWLIAYRSVCTSERERVHDVRSLYPSVRMSGFESYGGSPASTAKTGVP